MEHIILPKGNYFLLAGALICKDGKLEGNNILIHIRNRTIKDLYGPVTSEQTSSLKGHFRLKENKIYSARVVLTFSLNFLPAFLGTENTYYRGQSRNKQRRKESVLYAIQKCQIKGALLIESLPCI